VGRRAAGGQRGKRDVASCRELEDLVFRGFGGGIYYSRAAMTPRQGDIRLYIFPTNLRTGARIRMACSVSFAQLAMGSPNPAFFMSFLLISPSWSLRTASSCLPWVRATHVSKTQKLLHFCMIQYFYKLSL